MVAILTPGEMETSLLLVTHAQTLSHYYPGNRVGKTILVTKSHLIHLIDKEIKADYSNNIETHLFGLS